MSALSTIEEAARRRAAAPSVRHDAPGRLPTPVSTFVGRAREVDDLVRLLPTARLVTLNGPAGIGKTRLALEVAGLLQGRFPGGVWMVDLAPVIDPGLVARTVSAWLRLPPVPELDPIDGLIARLRPKRTLLVLDNCEHLLEACCRLALTLLEAAPQLSILTTTQRALDVEGEHVVPVSPLALPGRSARTVAERALRSEAVELFCARAQATSAGFRLTDETAPSVTEICHRLAGIPLAIELAAARAGVLAPAEIAERLNDRFSLLTRGTQTAPARHQTLRAALDWSYDLLSPSEAALLRRISVFTGGATLRAVEEVCSGGDVARAQVLDIIAELSDRSLLTTDTSGAWARYQLLESVRDYGRMRLVEAEELEDQRLRHAAWCLALAEQAPPHVLAGEQHWLDMLELEMDNVRSALDFAARAPEDGLGLRLAVAANCFWSIRGQYSEGQRWVTRMMELSPEAPAFLRARAHCEIGLVAVLQGDAAAAVPAVEEGLAVARAAQLPRAEASALNLLGFISIFTQDPLSAMPLLEESVVLTRALGDVSLLLNALELYGRSHLFVGDTAAARRVFEECMELASDEDAAGMCGALIGLGWTAFVAGEQRQAQELFDRALPVGKQGGDRFETALVLSFLGELAWARGDVIEARMRLDEGLALAKAVGAPFPLVRCLCGLARLAQCDGDLEAAQALVDDACTLARRSRLPYAYVRCLHAQGAVRLARGDAQGAQLSLDEALATAGENFDEAGVAGSSHQLARLARARGNDDRAVTLHAEALAIQARIPDAGGMASSLESLAGMALANRRHAHAARLFGAAQAIRDGAGALRPADEAPGYRSDVTRLRTETTGPSGLVARSARLAEVDPAWAAGAALSPGEAMALATRGRGPRHRPSSGLASLTPGERQVVDLAALGLTNNEIAERLFVSARTIQGRLLRSFPKLGVTSRRQLRELDFEQERA